MSEALTQFGTCSFQIVHEGEWLPLWEQESYRVTRHVPGGDTNITQLLGLGPLTITYTIECDDQAAYAALAAVVQTQATLRIPKTIAEDEIGTEVVLFGALYTEITEVTLMDLSRPMIALDQSVQVSATFQRQDRTA